MLGAAGSKATPSVEELLAGLDHPLRDDIDALRQLIRSAVDGVQESVKWNSPSFALGEHFATLRLTGKVPLQLILHLGAKKSALPAGAVADPDALLRWLGPDRACIDFERPGDVQRRSAALHAILRQWAAHVPARRLP